MSNERSVLFYTPQQREAAVRADLYEYLRDNHNSHFTVEGDSLRMLDNHSISIRQGYSGYYDFATGEHGNGIDFLIKYFDYTIPEAIASLNDEEMKHKICIISDFGLLPTPRIFCGSNVYTSPFNWKSTLHQGLSRYVQDSESGAESWKITYQESQKYEVICEYGQLQAIGTLDEVEMIIHRKNDEIDSVATIRRIYNGSSIPNDEYYEIWPYFDIEIRDDLEEGLIFPLITFPMLRFAL